MKCPFHNHVPMLWGLNSHVHKSRAKWKYGNLTNPTRWDAYTKNLSLAVIGYLSLYRFFFSVTLTFRSRAKFELSPDFESWASKWIDALKASSGKKLKIKSRKLYKSRELVENHFYSHQRQHSIGVGVEVKHWACCLIFVCDLAKAIMFSELQLLRLQNEKMYENQHMFCSEY